MAIRTRDEVIVDLITNILREEGKADVMPGQVLRDISVNSPALEIENLYNQIERVAVAQSVSNANFMTEQELNNLMSNFGIKRRGATKAIGKVTFYTPTQPTQTVTIPKDTSLGTNLGSAGKEVVFLTRYDVVFNTDVEASYYNSDTGNWEITVDVTAQDGGTDSNVGAYTITKVRNVNIPFQVTNYNPTSGGVDQESNQDFAIRALNIILGSNAGTENGYRGMALTQDNVLDTLVVGPGEALMTRDGGYGGKVDVWIVPAESGFTEIGPESNPELSFLWDNGQQFNEGYRFDFPIKPLDANSPVQIFGTTAPSGNINNVILYESRNPAPSTVAYVDPSGSRYHYTIFKADDLDTGHSIYANDYILWNANEMEYLRTFNPSGSPFTGNSLQVDINYSYDKAVNDLQTVIDSPDNKILTADVLAKEAQQILIDCSMSVQLLPPFKITSATENNTLANVRNAIATTINNISLGNTIQESDLVQAAHNVEGVDNIILNSVTLTKKRPIYFDTSTEAIVDDQALDNQYFISDNIVARSV
jgi:hypothetical protein